MHVLDNSDIIKLAKILHFYLFILEICGVYWNLIPCQSANFITFTFTFTFNHLADTFIQSDVQMRRTIEAIRPSREQQYTSAMTSLS